MRTNAVPSYDAGDNPTWCCARFHSKNREGWTWRFRNGLSLRAKTKSRDHIPLNIDKVFTKAFAMIEKAGALDPKDVLGLSRNLSPTPGEHLWAVSKSVPGYEVFQLSRDFTTKLFYGRIKRRLGGKLLSLRSSQLRIREFRTSTSLMRPARNSRRLREE